MHLVKKTTGDHALESLLDHIPDRELQRFVLRGRRYLTISSQAQIGLSDFSGASSLATVIHVTGGRVEGPWLDSTIETFLQADDVLSEDFLAGVIFCSTDGKELTVTEEANGVLARHGTRWFDVVLPRAEFSIPLEGPHVASSRQLLEVWRVYDDTHGAFLTPTVPSPDKAFRTLECAGHDIDTLAVAVPSRLRGRLESELPLKGTRVAVKDNHLLKGVKTSLCNSAYYNLYPPATETAVCIETLIKAGATIVGNTKLASFAATEEPLECVDFQAPWNPRADGYQSPAGSSSGSGAAVAAYEWLDFAVGSDTSGSGRRPGHWNGCFTLRPTHGVLSPEGSVPSFPQFDMSVFYSRSIEDCQLFATAWLNSNLLVDKTSWKPSRIVGARDYLDLIHNQDQLKLIEKFGLDLSKALGLKYEHISFENVWKQNPPSEAGILGLTEYMGRTCRDSFFHDDYHNTDQFRKDYHQKYGKNPYISPPVRWQWQLSASITLEERNIAMEKLKIYDSWFKEHILQDTIVIHPIEEISPRYRDEMPQKWFNPVGVPMLFLSPITGGPELTVPIGDVPYLSKVTGNNENLPVGISLLTQPGTDLHLIRAVKDALSHSNRPGTVLAGTKRMFTADS